jgi:hypothetical protein
MPQISYSVAIQGAGLSIQPPPVLRSGNTGIGVAAAPAGRHRRRPAHHAHQQHGRHHHVRQPPFLVGDKVDVYWTGGQAYGANVDAKDATTITISGLAGTVLPALNTTGLIVTKQVSVSVSIVYTLLQFLSLLFSFTSQASRAKARSRSKTAAAPCSRMS